MTFGFPDWLVRTFLPSVGIRVGSIQTSAKITPAAKANGIQIEVVIRLNIPRLNQHRRCIRITTVDASRACNVCRVTLNARVRKRVINPCR